MENNEKSMFQPEWTLQEIEIILSRKLKRFQQIWSFESRISNQYSYKPRFFQNKRKYRRAFFL